MAIFLPITGYAVVRDTDELIARSDRAVKEIAARSYPEIDVSKVRIKLFSSPSNYFKSRFSIGRFLTPMKMRHLLYVNEALTAIHIPDRVFEAVIAHELSHISYYTRKNRLELLGLAALVSDGFRARFERRADLDAIKRGYGNGLADYREWLYIRIAPEFLESKKKNYLTPEEIRLIEDAAAKDPGLLETLKKEVPDNIEQLRRLIERSKRKTDSGN